MRWPSLLLGMVLVERTSEERRWSELALRALRQLGGDSQMVVGAKPRRLQFDRGPQHGEHDLPSWRRQKLGFLLSNGFHFDVKHDAGASFQLPDQDGEQHKYSRYTNVDPHGFLRGGR